MDSNLRNRELWVAFKKGDSEALGQLASAHYRTLYNYATKFTKDRELIKDCIQDLFLHLWDQRANLQSSPFVTIYLLKSLKYNLLKKLNQEKKWILDDIDADYAPVENSNVESSIIDLELFNENEQKVKSILSSLPKRQQEVIFLKFYETLSIEEIAEIMEMNKQSVSNLLQRAIQNLKQHWLVGVGLFFYLYLWI